MNQDCKHRNRCWEYISESCPVLNGQPSKDEYEYPTAKDMCNRYEPMEADR